MNIRKMIMMVDDNPANLTMGKEMLKDHYKVSPLLSAEMMFDLLENIIPDLILLDIEMPEMDGFEAIEKLKANPKWAHIPVIFLTSKVGEADEYCGLSLGGADYVHKPFVAPLLIKRIEHQLLISDQRAQLQSENMGLMEDMTVKNRQIYDLQNAILNIVANLVEFRDDITGGHIMRLQRFLEILIDQMLLDGIYVNEIKTWNFDFLYPSSQLHDLGKIGIADDILEKPGKLTPEEFEVMKTHVNIGVAAIRKMEDIVKEGTFLLHARLFAGSHHEKWDGSGYPSGLKGADIPLEGRLLAIVDVYDALVSKRPYKTPMGTSEANKIILDGAGTHFDPTLVKVFAEVSGKFAEVVTRGGLL